MLAANRWCMYVCIGRCEKKEKKNKREIKLKNKKGRFYKGEEVDT